MWLKLVIMKKVNWQGDGDRINLSMPISKVDVEKRLVQGWASIDNIDQHRDLVDSEASRKAFSEFRGNIREQHDEKKAAGRLVNFTEDTVYDPKEDKFYQGVYVTAYVSKGAQDTWEKVLDGTLSGFSIGGNVLEAQNDIDADGNPFRRVTKYLLTELSLVDNPANHLANVDSFVKVIGVAESDADEMTLTGDLADITMENIFVCNSCLDDGLGVHKSRDESVQCPICDTEMVRIGFVESSDPEPKDTIRKMVSDYRADREGGVTETMTDKVEVAESEKTVELEEVQPVEEVATEEAQKQKEETVDVEEVSDPLTAAVRDLRELTNRIESQHETQAEEIVTLRKSLTDTEARFEERLNTLVENVQELRERQESFSKQFEGMEGSIDEVRKGLTEVDASTAIKKSADFDQPAEEEKPKNIWAGSFLNIGSL